MKRKPWKNKKGFTLVELIVVLVILAILIALLVPALTGYIDKARKKAKLLECRQCVVAAQTMLSEMYGAQAGQTRMELNPLINGKRDEIKKMAEVPGIISKIVVADTAIVNKLTYDTTNGLRVIYDRGKSPEYYISDEKIYADTAPGYNEWADDLGLDEYAPEVFLDENGKIKKEYYDLLGLSGNQEGELKLNASRRLQAIFLERFGGVFPAVEWEEIKLPEGVRVPTGDYVWKPIVTASGETIITADSRNTTGNSQASVVYYNGDYYYHWNGHNASQIDSSSIGDKDFNIDNLLNNKQWVKIEQ